MEENGQDTEQVPVAMSNRRLLFHNDSRHSYMYCYDPPMRIEDAWKPVDEIVGTGVDTLVYGFGAGPTLFHDTKVGEIWGSHLDTFPALHAWRAYENVRSLIDRGLDPLNVLIERAHDKGIEFFASSRQSHQANPADVGDVFNWQFRIDHPEWCLTGPGRYAFNWVHPEVRAERFAIIEETVNEYGVDGFEVDWVYWPHYFEEGEADENARILTEYMAQVRATVDAASKRKGKTIALGARVLPTLEGNRAAGIDVPAWIDQSLLDFVVPTIYQDMQMDADLPFEWLVELTKDTPCEVYPSLQAQIWRSLDRDTWKSFRRKRYDQASLDQYRAAAAAYWAKGADAIYLPWFAWPQGADDRRVLSEIHDPTRLAHLSKHYVTKRDHEGASQFLYESELPVELPTGADAKTVSFYVAEEPDDIRAVLRLLFMYQTVHDSMTVTLNETPLDNESAWRTIHGFTHIYLDYPLPSGSLRPGRDEVSVAIHSRPENLAHTVSLEGVEVIIEHPPVKGFLWD